MDKNKEEKILNTIERYGMISGSHHKQWILNEILKTTLGDKYDEWVKEFNSYKDENNEMYDNWDVGVAP